MTYWAGGLPTKLLEDFESASKRHANGDEPKRLYIGYHGHRYEGVSGSNNSSNSSDSKKGSTTITSTATVAKTNRRKKTT